MKYGSASSSLSNPEASVRALATELAPVEDPSLVVCFASPRYPTAAVAESLARAFPSAQTFGCSTAGEIASGRMLEGSLVALAFSRTVLPEVHAALATSISSHTRQAVERSAATLAQAAGRPLAELPHDDYVALVTVDGLSRSEEALMDALGDLTNVRVVGGSAGDGLAFRSTRVFANGVAETDAAALALLRPAVRFEIVKTQSFRRLGEVLRVTRCDEAERRVIELNGRPAALAYAEAVGVPIEELPARFMRNPLGLLVSGDPFVRSPQRVDGTDVVFYCAVREGTELELLESGDIVADTRAALDGLRQGFGPIGALIDFHCILRTIELRARGGLAAYGALSEGMPCAGFSTYGEQYVGHMNQTSTIVAFAAL